MRRRIGTLLLWIGVLAWVPYAVLKYGAGRSVSAAPFLAVHLLGVIPGLALRRWETIRRLTRRSTQGSSKTERGSAGEDLDR
jgi:hypothetical protein